VLFLLFPSAILVLLIVWLAGCFVRGVQKKWYSASQQLIKIVVFCVLVGPCIRAGDYIHLILMYPRYAASISAAGNTDKPLRFEWGDKAHWVTDGLQFDTLVYDPTDALSAAVGKDRGSGEMGLATRHLFGHFYVEREFSE